MRSRPVVDPHAQQFDEYPNSITFVEHVVETPAKKPIDWAVVFTYAAILSGVVTWIVGLIVFVGWMLT